MSRRIPVVPRHAGLPALAAAAALLLGLLGPAAGLPGPDHPRLRLGLAGAWPPVIPLPDWTVTVATLNLAHGGNAADGAGLEAAARLLERAGAEVAGLQEVDRGLARSGGVDQAAWLARRLGVDGAFGPALRRGRGAYGNALLSRWPVLAARSVPLPGEGEPRAALDARLATPAGPVRVLVTHLGLDVPARRRQAEALAGLLAADPGVPTLLLGDFNADPDAPELAPIAARLRRLSAPPTYPAPDPRHRSDGIYVSVHWQPQAVWVDPEPVSDHRALLARLGLVAGTGP